jgi:cephalosporin hydroxylase
MRKIEKAPVVIKNSINTISKEEIERFIIDNGSEDLCVFGGFRVGGNFCQQVPDEAANCIFSLLESGAKINSYLEVGAAAGGTTFLFNNYFHPSKVVIVDNDSHPRCTLRGDILTGIDYTEVIGDSQLENTIKQAGEYAPFDFIVLDAVHSYNETKGDVTNYSQFLSDGGYLFLHDSVWSGGQVDKVVDELKNDDNFDFVNEWVSETHKSNPCGIALFKKKGRK